nr:MAG TPA: hypothetical protein [Caudoviricetes sp.]
MWNIFEPSVVMFGVPATKNFLNYPFSKSSCNLLLLPIFLSIKFSARRFLSKNSEEELPTLQP